MFKDDLFKKMYDEQSFALFTYAYRFISDREDAKDIVNMAFLKIYEAWESEIECVPAFLYTLVRNACIDYMRKKNKALKNKDALVISIMKQALPADHELDDTQKKLLSLVYAEIENLPVGCREIFKLSYLEELKNKEIAARLQISEKTVRNQLSTARKKLRTIFRHSHLGRGGKNISMKSLIDEIDADYSNFITQQFS